MIEGHVQRNEAGELTLQLVGPKHFKSPAAIVVSSLGVAEKWVYFYNRLYISNTLTAWLEERRNVFIHVGDPRAQLAAALILLFSKHRLSPFAFNCRLVNARAEALLAMAPQPTSRHYSRYQEMIVPVLNFCQSLVEAAVAC